MAEYHYINDLYPVQVSNTNYNNLTQKDSAISVSKSGLNAAGTINLGNFLFKPDIPQTGAIMIDAITLKYDAQSNRSNSGLYKCEITPTFQIYSDSISSVNSLPELKASQGLTTTSIIGDNYKDKYQSVSMSLPKESFINKHLINGGGSLLNNGIIINIQIYIKTAGAEVNGKLKNLKLDIKYAYQGKIYINEETFDLDMSSNSSILNQGIGGSITSSITSGEYYDFGTSYKLEAKANTNFQFKEWEIKRDNSSISEKSQNNPLNETIKNKSVFYTGIFERSFYTISTAVLPENAGTVEGGGRYYVETFDKTNFLKAIPNPGYKFSHWSDEQTSAEIEIYPANGSKSYTAYFEPVYVSYDSIFNFQRWWDNGISGLGGCNVTPVFDQSLSGNSLTGFELYLNYSGNDAQTTESPIFKVKPGQTYVFEVEAEAENSATFQTFVFYCDKNGEWDKGTHTDGTNTFNQTKYEFTPTTDRIRIRCDIDGQGQYPCSVQFKNFRIYPVESEWMSNSLTANKRSNSLNWDIPLPERYRYTFDSWQDIEGNIYNNNSTYPTGDLTLYSHWKEINLFKELLKSSQIYYENQLASDIYFEGTKL